MSQVQNLETQIAKLQAEKVSLEAAQNQLESSQHWLTFAAANFDNLIHTSKLYGQEYNISFKASKEFLDFLLIQIEQDTLSLVKSLGGSGFYSYKQIPAIGNAKDQISKKDASAVFNRNFETLVSLSSGLKLEFYTLVDAKIVKVSIDFLGLVINERYSTKAKGYKIPHLSENTQYTKDGVHGSKYLGKNGAMNTNNDLGYSQSAISLKEEILTCGVYA